MGDEILWRCNETELIQIARKQGLPPLRRGLALADYVAIVSGAREPTHDELSNTCYTRAKLQRFLADHWAQIQSQLPGCNGQCSSYPCSEGRHMLCFSSNEDLAR